jgi:beta-glucosidase
MSNVSTYLTAMQEEAANAGGATSVSFVRGSRVLHPDGTTGLANASAAAAAADLVLLVVGTGTQVEVEGLDRTNLTLPAAQQALVAAVASSLRPSATLIVVIVSAGAVDFELPRANAVLYAPYGGEETGHGMLDLLMGRAIPSARMPVTAYRAKYLGIIPPVANFNMVSQVAGFPVGRTYRYFNDTAAQIATQSSTPFILYHFGYGLSYCTFSYSSLAAQVQADNSVTVQVTVQASSRNALPSTPACREVTQVYLTLPQVSGAVVPIYSLSAFSSTELPQVGVPQQLHFTLPADHFLTTYNNGTRALVAGDYSISVSGHLPDDAAGTARMSNVLGTSVALPWSG